MSDELSALRERFERLNLLYQVSHVLHSTLEPREALQLILREAVRLTRANSGSVVLINPGTGFLEIEAAHGLPPRAAQLKLRIGEGITGWVARTGQAARVGNVRQDPRYIMVREHVRSELAVPLVVQGDVRGLVNVDSDRANAFSAADQELLEGLALQAARVIQNTWLYEQLRLKARLFEGLASVSRAINSPVNLDEVLKVITREACALVDAKMSTLLLLDDRGEWLDLRAHHGAGEAYVRKPRLAVAESFLGMVVRRRKPAQVENVQTSSRYQQGAMARQEGLVSLASVPLCYQGVALGVLNVYTGQPRRFANEELAILLALAELSALAIEKARLYERIVDLEEQLRRNEKLSALGLLAAEVAHEIRNPLTVMKLLYHSLDLRYAAGDPRAKDARMLGEKMDQLNHIVEQILAFARRVEPRLGPVDLRRVLHDLELLTRHKLRQHQVQWRCQLAAGLPLLQADATQLEQAFLNLTLNAVEAMPGGGALEVSARSLRLPRRSPQPTHVAVEFKDTGVGISEEQQRRLTTSLLSSTKAKGTGLGLAIVRRVVETHRGRLHLQSQPGRGTTVTLTLPVNPGPG